MLLRTALAALVVVSTVSGMGVHNAAGCAECANGAGAVPFRQPVAVNPCAKPACGPNTSCEVNHRGIGVCKCLDGFFPKPNTITGCGPQCLSDGECGRGYVCRSTRCVQVTASRGSAHTGGFSGTASRGTAAAAVADACSLGLCGRNANCDNVNGRAVCSCPAGYEGNPLTACSRGECIADVDCRAGLTCIGVRCISPCADQPCGSGAECKVVNRRAICTCPRGYSGNPLSACVYDPNRAGSGAVHTGGVNSPAFSGFSNTQYQDVCRPSPCGENTNCRAKVGRAICSCIQNYIGNPLSACRPECVSDAECAAHQACSQNRCRNACTGACGQGARCEAVNHRAVCTCPQYYRGTGLTGCYPECTSHAECGSTQACIQLRCGDPCNGACGVGANCRARDHTAICSCPAGYVGHPYDRCSPPQQQDTTSGAHSAGVFVSGRPTSGNMCSPNPCGTFADCAPGFDRSGKPRPVCTCPRGYLGDPLTACRRGECADHSNCGASQACYNYQCTDPCIGEDGGSVCGVNARCRAQNHQGVCTCPPSYTGDPLTQCSRKPVGINPPAASAPAATGGHGGCATC